ncbi:MAG: putative metalloprotease CJM1_0395 family protein [Sulfuricellaceae bacterium]|jgi:hypothetical protein
MNVSPLPASPVFPAAAASSGKAGSAAEKGSQPLDPQSEAKVQELQKRDREVRAHEAAHVAAGGAYIRGGPSFQFTTGPDGKSYATGGEVSIDSSPIPDDPAATIQKMRTVQRAALAPAQPSAQDRSVAAAAAQNEAKARMEQLRGQFGTAKNSDASPGSLINEFA